MLVTAVGINSQAGIIFSLMSNSGAILEEEAEEEGGIKQPGSVVIIIIIIADVIIISIATTSILHVKLIITVNKSVYCKRSYAI